MPEKLQCQCPRCGKLGKFENWKGSPYTAEDQPVRMTCGTCAAWKNYEATQGRVKGVIRVIRH